MYNYLLEIVGNH